MNGSGAKGPSGNLAPPSVLFVGNSYIYTNDLPAAVSRVAASRGIALDVGMLAAPDFAIGDHVANGSYEYLLAGRWTWVVLQQGPSSLPENRESLRISVLRATSDARRYDSKVALMSAWPAAWNVHTWLDAELSYRLAAMSSGTCVLPVATAWRYAVARHGDEYLYSNDGLHPRPAGTLLAALTIVHGLTNRPYRPEVPDLSRYFDSTWGEALAATPELDEIARRAVSDERARCFLAK
jgi:hypothetical protein